MNEHNRAGRLWDSDRIDQEERLERWWLEMAREDRKYEKRQRKEVKRQEKLGLRGDLGLDWQHGWNPVRWDWAFIVAGGLIGVGVVWVMIRWIG